MAKFKLVDQSKKDSNAYVYNGYLNNKEQFDILGHITWLDSKEYYIGEWKEGSRTGKGAYKFPSGDCYYGEFKNTNKHGIGLYSYIKKEFYLGNFIDNMRTGFGVYIFSNGDFVYGKFENGKVHGKAVYFHADSRKFEFNLYENGTEKKELLINDQFIIDGKWDSTPILLNNYDNAKYNYTSGTNSTNVKWEFNGQVDKNNSYTGIGCMEWADRSYYFGELVNGNREGIGMFKYNDGNYYFGRQKNQVINGNGFYLNTDKNKAYFGSYKNDMKNGPTFIFYDTGELYYGSFKDNILQGNVLIIDKDFGVSFNTYKDNKYVSEDKLFPFNIGNDSNINENTFINPNNNNNNNNNNVNFSELFNEVFNKDNNNSQNNSKPASSPSTNKSPVKIDANKALDELVGLTSVKRELKRIKAYAVKNKDKNINIHMAFLGNPGTGKTEVARLIGQILFEAGVLKNTNFVECSRETLISMYIGETAIKTKKAIDEAMGGVLFIDEAYSLYQKGSEKDFGKEAIVELLKAMEDSRGDFCCIMAGYNNEMMGLFEANPGFKSRVQFFINFPDYSFDELSQIGKIMLNKMDYQMDDEALKLAIKIAYNKHTLPNFANAREVRNILEKTAIIQALRTEDDFENRTITKEDIETFANEHDIKLDEESDTIKVPMVKLSYLEELAKNYVGKNVVDNMIDVKEAVISLKVQMPNGKSESSGFIITPDGYAVTCAHCVNGEKGIEVRRRILDRRGNEVDVYYKAVLVAMDVPADVAIIKILDLEGDNAYINLLPHGYKDYDALDNIIMLGYPFGVSRFDNISTNVGRIVSYQKRTDGPDFINIDLSAKSGNSGSGVLNLEQGYAIGVLCGGNLSHNGTTYEEVNYCRPISYVWDLIVNNQEK